MPIIYLDHISATPLHPQALEAMLPYLKERFGNPSSLHGPAAAAREALESAREKVASLIGASPRELLFTATATESNNLAVRGSVAAIRKRGNHIITSSIEHISVDGPLSDLEKDGFEVTRLPVDSAGRVDPEAVSAALKKETVLISVQHANPEIGTIQQLDRIGAIARNRGVLFHADAAITAGFLPLDVDRLGIDLLTLSAQSVFGPKGAAALYVRRGVRLRPIMEGGKQENGKRPGTENVPAIVGYGVSAEIAKAELDERMKRMTRLGSLLNQGLSERIPGFLSTGPSEGRLPGHVSGCIEGAEGEALTVLLKDEGIIATTGTACISADLGGSRTLRAIGIDPALARTAVILSAGIETSEDDVVQVIDRMPGLVRRIRDSLPVESS